MRVVILINKELGMSPGKIAAQACHAVLSLFHEGAPTYDACIVLYAPNAKFLIDAYRQVSHCRTAYAGDVIADAGRTEIEPGSRTALALFGPKEEIDPITGSLELV